MNKEPRQPARLAVGEPWPLKTVWPKSARDHRVLDAWHIRWFERLLDNTDKELAAIANAVGLQPPGVAKLVARSRTRIFAEWVKLMMHSDDLVQLAAYGRKRGRSVATFYRKRFGR